MWYDHPFPLKQFGSLNLYTFFKLCCPKHLGELATVVLWIYATSVSCASSYNPRLTPSC